MKFQQRILISISFGVLIGVFALVANLFLPEIFHVKGCVPAGVTAVIAGNSALRHAGKPMLSPWWLFIFWGILACLLAFMLAAFFITVLALPPVPSWPAIVGLMTAIGYYVGAASKQAATVTHTTE